MLAALLAALLAADRALSDSASHTHGDKKLCELVQFNKGVNFTV
jgi:hypothetical protein